MVKLDILKGFNVPNITFFHKEEVTVNNAKNGHNFFIYGQEIYLAFDGINLQNSNDYELFCNSIWTLSSQLDEFLSDHITILSYYYKGYVLDNGLIKYFKDCNYAFDILLQAEIVR